VRAAEREAGRRVAAHVIERFGVGVDAVLAGCARLMPAMTAAKGLFAAARLGYSSQASRLAAAGVAR
jgi:hypothetical protein